MTTRLFWPLALIALAGCDKTPPEPVGSSTRPAAPQGQPASASKPTPTPAAGAGAITWSKPDAWTQVDDNRPMRKATYKIAKVEGDAEDAEMSVTQVGGTVEANIKRWRDQFDGSPEPKLTDTEVGGVKVTVVELSGTFKGGGPMMGGGDGGPKEGWAMLAAIAHTQPAAHFFKMTGPQKTVESARGDFDVLVGSIAAK